MPSVEEFNLRESDQAECRGVYIFNTEYWGKNRIVDKKSNPEEKTTIVTSLVIFTINGKLDIMESLLLAPYSQSNRLNRKEDIHCKEALFDFIASIDKRK